MDAHTFMRSLFALRGYFVRIAEAGRQAGADFGELERCGIAAEARMLAATQGVNTHRGAIFTLGLLCAAAGAATLEGDGAMRPAQLRDALRRHWGPALTARSLRAPTLPGGIATRRLGLRGASEEAALGFPVLFEVAVPTLVKGLAEACRPARGSTPVSRQRALTTAIRASRRPAGLRHRAAARRFIAAGEAGGGAGAGPGDGRRFVARRPSPGGARIRSLRRAGSRASVPPHELRTAVLRPGHPARGHDALAGRRRARGRDACPARRQRLATQPGGPVLGGQQCQRADAADRPRAGSMGPACADGPAA